MDKKVIILWFGVWMDILLLHQFIDGNKMYLKYIYIYNYKYIFSIKRMYNV